MRVFKIVFAILAVINLSGCVVAAIGIMESTKISREFNVPYDKVFEAAKSAFSSLDLTIDNAAIGKHTATVNGKYPDGKPVDVAIIKIKDSSCNVQVQVGSFVSQDKAGAANILDAISRQLGA